MTRRGKVDRSFFAEHIATRLGAPREDIRKGPSYGVDFGVADIGDQALVVASDPISILPALGFERAGEFAIRFALADVAVSGLQPTHTTISFALPASMANDEFQAVWRAIDAECADLGIGVVAGHTGRYPDAAFPWVGSATAMAVGDPDDIVYPDGATPGDRLLVTKGPAVETTGLLTTLFPDQIDLDEATLATAQNRLEDTGVVRDAMAASDAGTPSAMHDATEGGLLGGLFEMATSADVQFRIDADAVPLMPGVNETCETLGIDPWKAGTGGTLVIALPPESVDPVVAALEARGTPVGVAGTVEAGEGVVIDGEQQKPPSGDASWPVYERFLQDE